jgi:hypothetical protein
MWIHDPETFKMPKKNSRSFYAFSFLKVHPHNYSMIKSHKEVTNSKYQGFFHFFVLLVDGRIRIRINTDWMRIQEVQKNTDPSDPDPKHWRKSNTMRIWHIFGEKTEREKIG